MKKLILAGSSMALCCLTACVMLQPPELVAFKRGYAHIKPSMTQAEVETLLGGPSVIQTHLNEGWGPIPATLATYRSTNQAGSMGLATIIYCGSNVVSKMFTTADNTQRNIR